MGIINKINGGSSLEKVIFEQRSEGSEGMRHPNMQGKWVPVGENGKFKPLG